MENSIRVRLVTGLGNREKMNIRVRLVTELGEREKMLVKESFLLEDNKIRNLNLTFPVSTP